MRKTYAIIASVLLCASAAQAQDAPSIVSDVTFSVEGQTQALDEDSIPIENCFVLPSVNDVVKIELKDFNPTFDSEEPWVPYVVWTMGAGYAIDQAFEQPTLLVGLENTYGFTLNKEKWGNPSGGNFYVTIMVCFVKLDGEDIVDMLYGADEEPVMYDVSYTTPNVFPAEFKYVYPDNNWENETFAEAYENGVITFGFTNPVTFSNESNVATITYLYEGDPCEETVTKSECSLDWNRLDGFYNVSFNYANEYYPIEGISQITITLNGTIYVPEEGATPVSVEVPSVELTKPVTNPAPRKQKSRMTEGLTSNNEIVNVYNIQGMLVKESINKSAINELPAGLYIVDGKKVVVR